MGVRLKVDREVPLIECWFCKETFILVKYRVPVPTPGAGPKILAKGEVCFCPFCGRNQQWREDAEEEEDENA